MNTVLPATTATEGLNNLSPIETVDNRDVSPNLTDPNITLLPPYRFLIFIAPTTYLLWSNCYCVSLLATAEEEPNVVTQIERNKAPSSIPSSSNIEKSNSRDDLVVALPNLVGVLQLARDEKRLKSGSVYHDFVRLHTVHYNFLASDGLGNDEKRRS